MDASNHLREHGYAIVRGVYRPEDVEALSMALDELQVAAAQYGASFRHQNLLWVVRTDPVVGKHLRFVHWPSYVSEVLARYRVDPRQLALVAPLLGRNIKQIGNQATWKTPGATDTGFGWHQDARFRRPSSAFRALARSYVQVLIAIDAHDRENGCLKLVPKTHRGLLELPVDRSVMDAGASDDLLPGFGLDPADVVHVELAPGDVVMWAAYTVHASEPNTSRRDRRAYINGYVRADASDRGEWAFRDGEPCQLGEPQLVQYDDLYSRPEPHYVEGSSLYPYRGR